MVFKLLASIIAVSMASALAWVYLRRATEEAGAPSPLVGHRPWRKVGAGICLLISIMFVLGIYVVDIPERPIPYALYWIIMLGLVVWLFVLAVRDIQYTRRLMRRWQGDRGKLDATQVKETQSRDHGSLPT